MKVGLGRSATGGDCAVPTVGRLTVPRSDDASLSMKLRGGRSKQACTMSIARTEAPVDRSRGRSYVDRTTRSCCKRFAKVGIVFLQRRSIGEVSTVVCIWEGDHRGGDGYNVVLRLHF